MTSNDDLAKILKSIEKHLEALVLCNYAKLRKEAFSTPAEEKVYELTGTKTRDEICSELHISPIDF